MPKTVMIHGKMSRNSNEHEALRRQESAYEDLLYLVNWIEDEIENLQDRPTYNGTQRIIAYSRVLNRLRPIVAKAEKIRQEFNLGS